METTLTPTGELIAASCSAQNGLAMVFTICFPHPSR
jgi:hypothetical protein